MLFQRAMDHQPARNPSRSSLVSLWPWLVVLLVLLFVGFIRFRLLDMPLERDEGEYAYAGQLILQGIPPYELAYNMKLPGTYFIYALGMAVFGETAPRCADARMARRPNLPIPCADSTLSTARWDAAAPPSLCAVFGWTRFPWALVPRAFPTTLPQPDRCLRYSRAPPSRFPRFQSLLCGG